MLREWGPDPITGKVMIYLAHYTPAAARLLAFRYGSSVLVSKQDMSVSVELNRRNDFAPYNGGDWLDVKCSSGPTVIDRSNGRTYTLSAGHCAGLGATITTHGQLMGKVVNRIYGTMDVERIDDLGGGYNGSVWGGSATAANPGSYIEVGALFAQPGALVTNTSAASGEISGIRVVAVNQMLTIAGHTVTNLTKVYKNGAQICQGGDSGGPWIQRVGTTDQAKVVGTTVAGSGRVGTGFSTCYYQQINNTMSAFNSYVP